MNGVPRVRRNNFSDALRSSRGATTRWRHPAKRTLVDSQAMARWSRSLAACRRAPGNGSDAFWWVGRSELTVMLDHAQAEVVVSRATFLFASRQSSEWWEPRP